VAVKGGEEQPALNQARNYFALSPEGGRVAFAETEGEAMVLTIASLVDGQTLNTFPLTDEGISNFALSPDGKKFAVAQGSWRHDAVLMKGLR